MFKKEKKNTFNLFNNFSFHNKITRKKKEGEGNESIFYPLPWRQKIDGRPKKLKLIQWDSGSPKQNHPVAYLEELHPVVCNPNWSFTLFRYIQPKKTDSDNGFCGSSLSIVLRFIHISFSIKCYRQSTNQQTNK